MASSVEPLRDQESGDWAVQAADTVERLVGTVSEKTTGPLTTIARALVFGLLAAILGVAVVVLFVILLVRVLDIWLKIWAAYAILGGIFTVAGLLLWSQRSRRSE